MNGRGLARLSIGWIALLPAPLAAQGPDLTGYALTLGTYVGESALAEPGFSNVERLRGMAAWAGDRFRFDGAYEHTLVLREAGASGATVFTATGATSGGDWLDLGGTIEERSRLTWRHRVDRLSVSIDVTRDAELIVGRQPVSWATTLVFTPADPFSPFDPSDPFRAYRQGVDAARLRVYPNATSEVDVVVRRADFGFQETTTAAVRGSTNVRGWDVAAWAGVVHDDAAGSLSLSGGLGSWAVRAEGTLRDAEGETALRTSVGVDRYFTLASRDLYLVLEYLHDGFGVDDAADIGLLVSREYAMRGELQASGSDQVAIQGSLQIHPLVGLSGLSLVNVRDGSLLLSPGMSVSATGNTSVSLGSFFSVGRRGVDLEEGLVRPRSEYGEVPFVAYLSWSWFF